jgi:predicted MFS family arabinose efflux permease
MGALGSLVFFGLVIGSATATFIFNFFSYKSIIVSCLFINAAGTILFTFRREYYLMCIARFISGFS